MNKDCENTKKVELLAPAGDFEKLRTAVLYGADAVYIGGKNLGLRARSKNFTDGEMKEAIQFAHKSGVKVYITANIYAHNDDLDGVAEYFKSLYEMGADALIISDPGIFSIARDAVPDMDIHISTQANNTNYKTVLFWKNLGAKRIVLARELSMAEIRNIYEKTGGGIELEVFAHGAMCISYSGRCLLSNYMTGRDANKGECAQPCRYSYSLVEEYRPNERFPIEEDARGTYIMNSKDLCMVSYMPELCGAGVSSIKIEGRVKTPFYVGTTVKAYREAIDDFYEDPAKYKTNKTYYTELVTKASNRDFTTGFFFGKPDANSHLYDTGSYNKFDFSGVVKYSEGDVAVIEQRNKFSVGDTVEFILAKGRGFKQVIKYMTDADGISIQNAPHPKQLVMLQTDKPVHAFDMMVLISKGK